MATAAQHRLTPASDTTPVIVRIPERELSGAHWVSRFPGSNSTTDLISPFREKADAFISALRAAGASVVMIATYRPKERAYLMHYSSAVARGTIKAVDVPEMEGVGIEWTHSTDEESKSAAKAMANGYQIVFPPALVSRHTARAAMDISLSWTSDLNIIDNSGDTVEIKSTPRNNMNKDLHEVGASYGVYKLVSDKPHWSDNGR